MSQSNFSSLTLSKEMLHNLKELGFTQMTAIQQESIPPILKGKDVLAQAKTGSGKTAAFGIGLLSTLNVNKFRVQSLVLCPTRELAEQVAKELRRLARFKHNIKILVLCGGAPFGPQLGSLRHGAHIIVGTPGRTLAHLEKKSLLLDDLATLVLDEADRMLDMGFIEEIEKVIAYAPEKRQSLLFSATYPDTIMQLSGRIQKDAVRVETIATESVNKISETFYAVSPTQKSIALIGVLAKHNPKNVIVFCNMKKDASEIADELNQKGIDALAIHGDLEQYERVDVLVQFMNHSCSVLVATDVAARGIDVKELAMVVNYDMPKGEDVYTHRIGRTGRAGQEGIAVSFFTEREVEEVEFYRNDTRQFLAFKSLDCDEAPEMQPPNVTLVIEGGKKDKVRAGDLLGALTKEGNIDAKYIGKIDIYERQAYVAISKEMIRKAHKALSSGKIKGRKFSVWILD
jgi:ATP-dependent RNA helicase DbpA